jgi:hypothetical protein
LTLLAQSIETLGIRVARRQKVGTAPVAFNKEVADAAVPFATLLATKTREFVHDLGLLGGVSATQTTATVRTMSRTAVVVIAASKEKEGRWPARVSPKSCLPAW